jgi:hypothetical protein
VFVDNQQLQVNYSGGKRGDFVSMQTVVIWKEISIVGKINSERFAEKSN